MANVTTVTLTNGVPTAPSGTVSTLDNLIGTAGAGASAQVLTVQGSATGTAVPVSVASLPLPTGAMASSGGSVTANAGSNLNTSLLALETGGNLATIVTRLTSLVTGTVLAAGSAIAGKFGIDQTTDGTTNAVRILAETTKVIGVVRTADGSGNLFTSTAGAVDVNIKSGINLNGRQADVASAPCALSNEDVAILGITTETAPATDTALSGLNGRLQRIAQNITSMVAAVLLTGGDVSSGSSDSGKPVKIGGVGLTANPTAVTTGQRVNASFDKLGKQVVVGSIRDLKVQQFTTITSSVSETTVLTAVASTFLDVYGVIIENTSASTCKVTFKDATAGTTRFELTVPAGDTRGFMLPESGAYPQAVINNNWTATCGTSLASIVITMLAVKNI